MEQGTGSSRKRRGRRALEEVFSSLWAAVTVGHVGIQNNLDKEGRESEMILCGIVLILAKENIRSFAKSKGFAKRCSGEW